MTGKSAQIDGRVRHPKAASMRPRRDDGEKVAGINAVAAFGEASMRPRRDDGEKVPLTGRFNPPAGASMRPRRDDGEKGPTLSSWRHFDPELQ